jgi:hypothetical protein
LQIQTLRAAGCEIIRSEKASGTSRDGRTELQLLLDFLRKGDTLIVTRVNRLARSIKDLQDIVYALNQQGITLKATEQPVDTRTAAGKAFLDMLGVFAEFETNLRRERQLEGIAAAKARGVYQGANRASILLRSVGCTLKRKAQRRFLANWGSVEPRSIVCWTAMSSRRKAIPTDSLLQLRQRLDRLPPKSPERAAQITAMALLYCISVTTVYRTLRAFQKPHIAHRRDHGKPRIPPPSELEYYCELIAALKLRTTNKAGRHLSTTRAIQLLEEHGVETTQGLVKLPKGLRRPTVNRLSLFRLDHSRLLREPPAARFRAGSNDCWQFDMSPSDLKYIECPEWIDPASWTTYPDVIQRGGRSQRLITRNTAVCMAKMRSLPCVFCLMPWRLKVIRRCLSRGDRKCCTSIMARWRKAMSSRM